AARRPAGALERAEVAVVLVDASEPLAEQDLRIVSMVIDAGRALVLAFNKWDLVDEDLRLRLDRDIDRQLHTARWAPRVNISAATGRHIDRLVPALELALAGWETRVPTGRLNAWVNDLVAATPPPARAGRVRGLAECPSRPAGRPPPAAFRVFHHRVPRSRLPAVPRAPAARGVRLPGQPGARVGARARATGGPRRRPGPGTPLTRRRAG